MKRKWSKKKKIIIGIVVGVLALFLLLLVLLVEFFYLFLTGGPAIKTQDIADYSMIHEKNIQSGMVIFPEEITGHAKNIEFDFYFQDTWNHPTVSVFLQVDYNAEDYEVEVERLENIKKIYNNEEVKLLRDKKDTYPYPAYIAIENHHHTYEYTLLSGENEITYIYISGFNQDDLRFDTEYLPSDFHYGAPKGEDQFYYGYCYYVDEIYKREAGGIIAYDYDKK